MQYKRFISINLLLFSAWKLICQYIYVEVEPVEAWRVPTTGVVWVVNDGVFPREKPDTDDWVAVPNVNPVVVVVILYGYLILLLTLKMKSKCKSKI